MSISLRSATPADAAALLTIYAYYVEETAISFEYVTPTEEAFRARIENTLKTHPYLVAEEAGRIIGYAYAGVFRPRAAYDHCCEVTIYLDRDRRRSGVGRMLYEQLERDLQNRGFELAYACIGLPRGKDPHVDTNSRDFHIHMGYRQVGHFHACGKKFGTYYDMIYMEKALV